MTPDEMRDKAIDLYRRRFHCSQAVLGAGLEKAGAVNEAVIKAFGAFGGGIAWSGRACGALTGGIGVIASIFSRGNFESKEDPRMSSVCRKFIMEFEKLAQGIWRDRLPRHCQTELAGQGDGEYFSQRSGEQKEDLLTARWRYCFCSRSPA